MSPGSRRRAVRGALCLALALQALAAAAFARAEAPLPARPTRYVTDGAGILPADRASALNEKLAAFERETSDQILVWTAPSIPEGFTLEDFANKSFHAWGVGQKGKSNGLVLFVFPTDRKMRIEVGYGLEGAIPDARVHQITDGVIKPHFKDGDFAAGIEAGMDAVFAAARGEPYKGTGRTVAEARAEAGTPLPVLIFLFVVFGFGGLVLFLVVKALRGGFSNLLSPGSRSGWVSTSGSSSGWSSSSSSSDSSSSDSSSSSSFDGGGGDSGGGGGSDSW